MFNIGCHDILVGSVESGNIGNTMEAEHDSIGILHATTWLQLVDQMVNHRIPEKTEALYFLIFIHLKMTLEELVQQLEAVFASIRSAYSDLVVSNTLSTIMVQQR